MEKGRELAENLTILIFRGCIFFFIIFFICHAACFICNLLIQQCVNKPSCELAIKNKNEINEHIMIRTNLDCCLVKDSQLRFLVNKEKLPVPSALAAKTPCVSLRSNKHTQCISFPVKYFARPFVELF